MVGFQTEGYVLNLSPFTRHIYQANIEEAEGYLDQKELVATQRHLIEVLKKENGALRLLRTQVESLRLENNQLKNDLTSLKKNSSEKDDGKADGKPDEKDTKVVSNGHINSDDEVERLRKDNDKLREKLGILENGKSETDPSVNGLQNGQLEEETEKETPNDGTVVHPGAKLKKEPIAAGPSGTSLVTVSCLLKCRGKFHDCDETMQARLKSYMSTKCVDLVLNDWQEGKDNNQITLVLCQATSTNYLLDIKKTLLGISSGAEIILVVYHLAGIDSERRDPQTDSLDLPHNNICLVVDTFFSKSNGLYRCEQNDRAMSRIYRLFDILC
ncbi:hypothetical protein BSL78_12859 [Apostichopus japonicus]|uniref:Uncharacterized protein n=1 Tax=Stichopus japonicus TaxID=307972 RepID=A0A2G8KQI8_STIJA|nr:hypothetical protein BSL78_12859 [Apostichopus japonicus]